jgi:hypothetical protein
MLEYPNPKIDDGYAPDISNDWDCCTPLHEKLEQIKTIRNAQKLRYPALYNDQPIIDENAYIINGDTLATENI